MPREPEPPDNAGAWYILHEDRINRLVRAVEGNGRKGLLTRMDEVEKFQAVTLAKQETTLRLLKWQIGVGISLILCTIAGTGLALQLLQHP